MVWLLFLDGVTHFFREMLFLQEREGTQWSQFFPVRITSFQKGFWVLMSDLPPLQMSYL